MNFWVKSIQDEKLPFHQFYIFSPEGRGKILKIYTQGAFPDPYKPFIVAHLYDIFVLVQCFFVTFTFPH